MSAIILDINQRLQGKRNIAEALKVCEVMSAEFDEVDAWIAKFFKQKQIDAQDRKTIEEHYKDLYTW